MCLMHNKLWWRTGDPSPDPPHHLGGQDSLPLFLGDTPGEGTPVVQKRLHLGLARSSIALRSWKGTGKEVGRGLSPHFPFSFPPPLFPPLPPFPLFRSRSPFFPLFSPSHLRPAHSSHQLPRAGDKDSLQLQ